MATRARPEASIMDQLEAGIQELDEVLQGKRTLRKVPVAVHTPAVYSAQDVRELRNDLNMSQAEFADLLEVSPRTVQAWEHGLRSPGFMTRCFLGAYSRPEMRDNLRLPRPPGRRRKVSPPTVSAPRQRVLAVATGRTAQTISAKVTSVRKKRGPQ